MTTNDDQYTPDEEQVRAWCRDGTGDYPDVMDEWLDRFLARVRRDAAREALDGLAENMTRIADETPDSLTRTAATITARMAGEYKSNAYPEETP